MRCTLLACRTDSADHPSKLASLAPQDDGEGEVVVASHLESASRLLTTGLTSWIALPGAPRCRQGARNRTLRLLTGMATSDRQMLVKALLRRIEGSRGKLPGERELALALGASRPSLREALGVLEALRLIERRPQSGIYVSRAAADASIEALVLRELLDKDR